MDLPLYVENLDIMCHTK